MEGNVLCFVLLSFIALNLISAASWETNNDASDDSF
jgi:hypothetical protein